MAYLQETVRLQIGALVAYKGFAGFLLDGFVSQLREAGFMELDNLQLTPSGIKAAIEGSNNPNCVSSVERYIFSSLMAYDLSTKLPSEHD